MEVIKVKFHIDQNLIKKITGVLQKGGIIVFPTSFLYGIGADVSNEAAIKKVFKIKKRIYSNPLSILVKDEIEVKKIARKIPPIAENLMKNFWPGKLTIIFEAKDNVSEMLTAGSKKIGIRIPEHPIAKAIVNSFENPITATSANISGNKAIYDIKDVGSNFFKNFDLVIDAGRLKGGSGSTIIDITDNDIKILREGAIKAKEIFSTIRI
jgi:L-threonylcarbamoyladenylate synthase